MHRRRPLQFFIVVLPRGNPAFDIVSPDNASTARRHATMSRVSHDMVVASFPETAEQRFLLPNVSWELFDRLLAEVGERYIRLTYERGDLELMAPSYRHERFARLIGGLPET